MTPPRSPRLSPELGAIPTPLFAWERRGDDLILVDWNDAAERQTRGNVSRILGKAAREVYANQPEVLRALGDTPPGCQPHSHTVDYLMLSTGERRALRVAYFAVGADLVVAATEDLSERQLTEQALEDSERRYRSLVEGVPDGIVVHRQGEIVFTNHAFATIVGAVSPGVIIGTRVLDHVHPDDRASVLARVRAIEKGGTAPLREERLLRADGTVVYAEITGIPTTFDGAPAVQALVRDVSERRKAQALFRAVTEQALTGVAVLQHEKVLYVNPRGAQLFGYDSPQDMIGVPYEECVAPSSLHHATEQLRERLARGASTVHYTCTARRKDGSEFETEVFGSVVDLDGVPALVATILDATEREHMAAQLRQAQKMEAVGRLAGGIAHDFNNILTAILSYADLVLSEVPNEGPIHADVLEIRNAGERAAALTRQLLAFSRQQALEHRVVDLNDVVAGMARMLERLIEARVTLVIEPSDETPKVMADRAQLEQVLLNLAVNARDAMARNGGRLTIRTGRALISETEAAAQPGLAAGAYASIQVTDTGPGIPPMVLPRIFEPFYTTKPSGEGTGLGLSVVYGIVQQSGGHVTVDSPPGHGATFTILLPALAAR